MRLREATYSRLSIVTPDTIKIEAMDPELVEIGLSRLKSPWCTGYPPERYWQGLDIIIHMNPDDSIPHRLRPILILDIEENLHKKILGRMAMRQAEELEGIYPEQYRIRESKAADTQALNTRLFYDYIRIQRIPSTRIFADLISNYDLVVHNIASLSLQIINPPKEPIMCTLTTLQDMNH